MPMESGINKIIKVVWLCHFSNKNILQKLKINKNIGELVPWITHGIEDAKKRNDIELHIVSPHKWVRTYKEFQESNIHYHFFNSGVPYYGRHWPGFFRFDLITNFFFNRKKIKRIINKINPDIIHLYGFENTYFSSAILDLPAYPHVITVEGFISRIKPGAGIFQKLLWNKRFYFESRIIKEMKNFAVRTEDMANEVKSQNPDAVFYWLENSIKHDIMFRGNISEKKYDIIYFAAITQIRGIEDLIKATGIISRKNNNIKLAVVGSSAEGYINKLKLLAAENDCEKNIDFIGFLPSQKEVHSVAIQSKISCLPCYQNMIPGTIIESMLLGIPVISCNVGGIPEINKDRENIILIKPGDIEALAEKIVFLIQNDKYREELVMKAYEYASDRWNNTKTMSNRMDIYRTITDKH